MGIIWMDAELARLKDRVATLEALNMLRDIHIAKLDECNVRLGAELQRTLAALGEVVRTKNEKNGHLVMAETELYSGAVCPRCGGPLDVSTHEFVPPFRCRACGGEWWLMQMPEYGGEGTA
jgi:hypothetical protein